VSQHSAGIFSNEDKQRSQIGNQLAFISNPSHSRQPDGKITLLTAPAKVSHQRSIGLAVRKSSIVPLNSKWP